MNWSILAIGKPKLAWARAGLAEYEPRLRPFARLELEYLKAGPRETESAALLERSRGALRIALDERGEQITSRALAERIGRWELERHKSVAVLVGGAEGHEETVRRGADWVWSLSQLTLQHELALVLVLEQIYRAYTIRAGSPYHRE